jgi:[protein-PII] uridylyltransferase
VLLSRARGDARTRIAVTKHRSHTELIVSAADEPGLLMRIAGVLLAHRVDIIAARIHSRAALEPGDRPEALDVFFVRDRVGRPIAAKDPRWEEVARDLETVSDVDALVAAGARKGGLPRRKTPDVATEIEVDNDVSEDFTVVDVYTHDRLGVLYAITRTLRELGLDIALSKVATEAERVADVFYVRDRENGAKIVDPVRLKEIEARLRAALAEVGAT